MAPKRDLTAAASRYTSRKIRGKGAGDQSWQLRAYDMYHQTPEVRFAASWIGNAMSGARLFAGRRTQDGSIEPAPPGHRASEIVAQIAGGPDGQSALLGAFGKHLTVPGEGWIIVRPNSEVLSPYSPEDGHDWRVLSIREVHRQSGKLVAEIDGEDVPIPEGDPDTMDPDGPVAIRVWEPDPERAIEADSPVRASLDLLEELLLLNAAVKAIARSRITGRGILLVPKGTRFPSSKQGGEEDDLIEIFMQIAETAIRDPESAAATVPVVLELPADTIADFKRVTFESEFDELALKLRDEAVRRFATGLEIPAEILLGLGDVNHWGAWALTSEAIRLGIEPKLSTVAHALTQQWLRPILEAENDPEWHRWLVWHDTSPLRVRTNRSETAMKLFELGAINGKATRRETGFDESDAPTAEEQRQRQQDTGDQAGPQTPRSGGGRLPVDESEAEPDTLPAAAVAPAADAATAADADGTGEGAGPQQPDRRPARPGPTAGDVGEGLLAAADGLIWSALTTAGEKLRRTPACPRSERSRTRDVESARLHTLLSVDRAQVEQWRLLDGAWSRAGEIASRYGLDLDCLSTSLDQYTRELIAAGIEHEWQLVPTVLTACTGGAR